MAGSCAGSVEFHGSSTQLRKNDVRIDPLPIVKLATALF